MKTFLTQESGTVQLDFLPPAMQWANYPDAGNEKPAAIPTELFYMDIADVTDFNSKIVNALHYIGVTKVHELARLCRRDLQKAEGIGKKARDTINGFLIQHQLAGFSDRV
jgi:DNA-directed RNA polymerase alpha subunit